MIAAHREVIRPPELRCVDRGHRAGVALGRFRGEVDREEQALGTAVGAARIVQRRGRHHLGTGRKPELLPEAEHSSPTTRPLISPL
ncbi:hypothetical protein AB0H00_14550 [Nocardia sp. NPDC023852]|uniref:hypothetical protein n=1 Tax=Nocardia sp. NPDC023852 TaxID=3154697 RepID=UPI0033F9F468